MMQQGKLSGLNKKAARQAGGNLIQAVAPLSNLTEEGCHSHC